MRTSTMPRNMETTSKFRYFEPTYLHDKDHVREKRLWLFVRWTKNGARRSVVEFGPALTLRTLQMQMGAWIRANRLRQLPKRLA